MTPRDTLPVPQRPRCAVIGCLRRPRPGYSLCPRCIRDWFADQVQALASPTTPDDHYPLVAPAWWGARELAPTSR
jgi:hypothetical protein